MSDALYRSIVRPLLFSLPAETGRDWGLAALDLASRLPGILPGPLPKAGPLQKSIAGITFPGPAGVGFELDPFGRGLTTLGRLQAGFVEVGPITVAPRSVDGRLERWPEQLGWWRPEPASSVGLGPWGERLTQIGRPDLPIIARISPVGNEPREELKVLVEGLIPWSRAFVLDCAVDVASRDFLRFAREITIEHSRPLWLRIPADLGPLELERRVATAVEAGLTGVRVDGVLHHEIGCLVGTPGLQIAVESIQRIRSKWPALHVLGSGGISSPQDALEFLDAGADLIAVDSGLVYSGPRLIQRINSAILAGGTSRR